MTQRKKTIRLVLSDSEKEVIEASAARDEIPVAVWVRATALKAAKKEN